MTCTCTRAQLMTWQKVTQSTRKTSEGGKCYHKVIIYLYREIREVIYGKVAKQRLEWEKKERRKGGRGREKEGEKDIERRIDLRLGGRKQNSRHRQQPVQRS